MADPLAFLRRWHDDTPGRTPQTFACLRDDQGRCSYNWLADLVQPGEQVLDLCCGDGPLLERIVAAGGQGIGVDASTGELQAARRRLGETATLHQGLAQQLPLPDASVDRVLCHMAFMLLLPVEPVIAEVARVLRPGGRFAAVVGAGPPVDDQATLVELLRRYPWRGGQLGDRRVRDPEALATILGPELGELTAEVRTVRATGSVAAMWEDFLRSYHPALFESAELEELRRDLHVALGDGSAHWGHRLLLLRAARR